jgi:hypothetical protein
MRGGNRNSRARFQWAAGASLSNPVPSAPPCRLTRRRVKPKTTCTKRGGCKGASLLFSRQSTRRIRYLKDAPHAHASGNLLLARQLVQEAFLYDR